MPWWFKSIPTIVSVLIEVAKFLFSLKDKAEAKSCAAAIDDASKAGDMAKLEQLIAKMKAGKKCD